MTLLEDLELKLKGLTLVRAILEQRGSNAPDVTRLSEEIVRVHARLRFEHAEGGDAQSVAA